MDDADLAALGTILGSMRASGLGSQEDLQARFSRLGDARLVALEVLMTRKGDFERDAATYRSDDTGSSHKDNRAWVVETIKDVVATIRADDTLTLTEGTEAYRLVLQAEGRDVPGDAARVIDVLAPSPRR